MNSRICDSCGRPIPPHAPGGICPVCLLSAGLGKAAETNPAEIAVPSAEELAPFFPQIEIIDLIGHGGMGAVYHAKQTKLDRQVALKIIRPEAAADPSFAERFAREARTLARLNHPNIVGIHDFGDFEAGYYFLMEFVDGANLRQLLDMGRMDANQAFSIVRQICDALQYAHDEGVIHRDIKPENILVDQQGRVRIADFGLARIAAGTRESNAEAYFSLTATHQIMGTPRYMAPEQIEASNRVDHRADIYSLGVVFYEMLTGEVPMGSFDPPSHKQDVDDRLDKVVLRAMAREPERRYQQASNIINDLDSIPTAAVPERTPADLPRPTLAHPAAGEHHGFSTILEREAQAVMPWIASAFEATPQPQRTPTLLMLLVCALGCLSVLFPWIKLTAIPPEGTTWAGSDSASALEPVTLQVYGSESHPGIVAASAFAVLGLILIAIPFRQRMPMFLACTMAITSTVPLLATIAFKSHTLQFPSSWRDKVQRTTLSSLEAQPTAAEAAHDSQWRPVPTQSGAESVVETEWEAGFYISLACAIGMLVFSAVAVRHAWVAPATSRRQRAPVADDLVRGGRDWVTLTREQVEQDEMPNICMVCGQATELRVNRTFQWAPDWAGALTMAGGMWGIIAIMTTNREFRLACPVCPRHRNHWSRFAWVCSTGWLVVLLIAAAFALAAAAFTYSWGPIIICGSVSAGIALTIWIVTMVRMGVTRVRAAKITKDSIRFERVASEFARAMSDGVRKQ